MCAGVARLPLCCARDAACAALCEGALSRLPAALLACTPLGPPPIALADLLEEPVSRGVPC